MLLILITVFLANSKIANAEDVESVTNSYCDRFNDLESSSQNSHQSEKKEVITEQNLALSGVVVPSLWWAREQFDPFDGRLIDDWLEDHQLKQIDLVVNWQLWTLLDYLGRYRLINQLGTVARQYNYNLRIINQQKQCLATYQYTVESNSPKWEINLDGLGQNSLQLEPSN
ncbi:MAG: hypothetical protein AB4372_10225 [Xenococcus sp. (in: cyanobacteria)]